MDHKEGIGELKGLEKVVDDSLSLIVRLLDANSIQLLSFTCPRMHARLMNGATVSSLRFVHLVSMRRFPKFIACFSALSELVLVLPTYDRRFLGFEPSVLHYMPKGLTKLHFHFLGAHGIWFRDFRVRSGATFHIGIDLAHESWRPMLVANILPNLQEMRLGGENRRAALKLIPGLPDSITSFSVYGCMWNDKSSVVIETLPSQLVSLKLERSNPFAPSAFSSLTQLDTLLLGTYFDSHPLSSMPTTLSKLVIRDSSLGAWKEQDLLWLDSLSLLTWVEFPNVNIIPYLSNKLHLRILKIVCPLTPAQIRLLPPNLSELVMDTLILPPDLTRYDFWPPRLKKVSFRISPETVPAPDHDFWLSLPTSLSFISIVDTQLASSIPIQKFPPALEKIFWRYRTMPEKIDFGAQKNLTDLHLYVNDWEPGFRYQMVFPPRLLHFGASGWQAYSMCWDMDHFVLPSTLLSLSLSVASNIDNTFMNNLPRGLTKLFLLLHYQQEAKIREEGLLNLPPHLSHLTIPISPNSNANAFFPKLPKHLTFLSLERITNIDCALLQHLPNEMTHLDLPRITRLTDAALPYLPKSLTRLLLPRNHPINPEPFFALQLPYLRYFDFRKNPNFSRKKVLQLAPPLMGFKTKKITREWCVDSEDWGLDIEKA